MPDHQLARQPASLSMNGGRGKKTQWPAGRCVVNRYEGEFQSAALNAKAETGLFYALCRGTGVWRVKGILPELP